MVNKRTITGFFSSNVEERSVKYIPVLCDLNNNNNNNNTFSEKRLISIPLHHIFTSMRSCPNVDYEKQLISSQFNLSIYGKIENHCISTGMSLISIMRREEDETILDPPLPPLAG